MATGETTTLPTSGARAQRVGLLLAVLLVTCSVAHADEQKRVTIIYDAMGVPSELERDWGFSALIEYAGRRILFDTGTDRGIFERNTERLGIDLTRLDAVIISHRHGDHTGGLSYLLEANPAVTIYAPSEGAMFAKAGLPPGFLEPYPDLPAEMRYFGGTVPEELPGGRSYIWDADFHTVRDTQEIFPGFFVLTTRSERPGTLEMSEVSLAVRTPRGLAVIVGCSHPGIGKILRKAAEIDPQLYTAIGGFHLVNTPRGEVEAAASELHDALGLDRVAPAHCTSELGFAMFMDRYGDRYDRAGAGTAIALP